MDFSQFTILEEFENFILHNELSSDQISEVVDRMMALAFPEKLGFYCKCYWWSNT